MKIRSFIILSVIFLCLFFSCSREKSKDTEILAMINGLELPLSEFLEKLSNEIEMERDFKLTNEAKDQFLEELIRKELLIQEAKRLKLDREEKFIKIIENYWESTLIRNLMEKKGMEISRTIVISQEEIMNHYESMKKQRSDLPAIEVIEDEIKNELKEKKKTQKLSEWIDSLRKTADIRIDRKMLYKN